MISRSQGLKLALGSLGSAVPAIFLGIVVCMLVIFIYATIGVSLFKGLFYSCRFPALIQNKEELIQMVETEADCLRLGGLWLNSVTNFDSFWSALSTLLEMITMEGWLDVMYQGVDGRSIGEQPK